MKSLSPSLSGLAFWRGLRRVRFLGLGFPEYSLKEGLLQSCWLGNEMVSAASWVTLGESGSLQRTKVLECHSTFSGKFGHLFDWGTRTLSGSECQLQQRVEDWATPEDFRPEHWAIPEDFCPTGWVGVEV